MMKSTSDPLPLVPLSVLALDSGENAAEMADRLADRTLVDDLGRICVDRPTARKIIAEFQQRLATEAEAVTARAEIERVRRDREAAEQLAQHAARRRPDERQRELLAQHPGMSALELMATAEELDLRLTRAGQQFDDLIAQSRGGPLTYHTIRTGDQ
jgi:hypothetical protein